uniref:Uncharacterized protein n=1 Tax=Glossina pallidipes TaxID=7398 RepID=A0A1B0A0L9_GLOPL
MPPRILLKHTLDTVNDENSDSLEDNAVLTMILHQIVIYLMAFLKGFLSSHRMLSNTSPHKSMHIFTQNQQSDKVYSGTSKDLIERKNSIMFNNYCIIFWGPPKKSPVFIHMGER